MGIHNKELVANKPVRWELAVEPEVETLPEVPAAVLRRAFQHLSPSEYEGALRQRLVPVAWLPNITLYADGNEATRTRQASARKRVIAWVAPKTFEAAVRRWLGPVLTQRACNGLQQSHPKLSASHRFSSAQKFWAWGLLAGLMLVERLVPITYFLDAVCLMLTALFACMIWLRLLAIGERAAPYKARPEMNDVALPVYTVLVPVFRETRVLTQLIGALRCLNYPQDKLDIKLILEETDAPILRKVSSLRLPCHMEVIVVPASHPQTKPKALNYALSFARGELLTIYDAEDIPEPMQLRMAAAGFAQFPPEVACLQAELTFYNPNENWLTRGIMAQTPQEMNPLHA